MAITIEAGHWPLRGFVTPLFPYVFEIFHHLNKMLKKILKSISLGSFKFSSHKGSLMW